MTSLIFYWTHSLSPSTASFSCFLGQFLDLLVQDISSTSDTDFGFFDLLLGVDWPCGDDAGPHGSAEYLMPNDTQPLVQNQAMGHAVVPQHSKLSTHFCWAVEPWMEILVKVSVCPLVHCDLGVCPSCWKAVATHGLQTISLENLQGLCFFVMFSFSLKWEVSFLKGIFICKHTSIWIHVHVCLFAYTYMCLFTHIYTCIFTYKYVCVCVTMIKTKQANIHKFNMVCSCVYVIERHYWGDSENDVIIS